MVNGVNQCTHDGRELRRIDVRHGGEDQRVVPDQVLHVSKLAFIDNVVRNPGHARLVLRCHKQVGIGSLAEIPGGRRVRVDDGDLVLPDFGRKRCGIGDLILRSGGVVAGQVGDHGGRARGCDLHGDVYCGRRRAARRWCQQAFGDGEFEALTVGRQGKVQRRRADQGLSRGARVEIGRAAAVERNVIIRTDIDAAPQVVARGAVEVRVEPDRGSRTDGRIRRGGRLDADQIGAECRGTVQRIAAYGAAGHTVDTLGGRPFRQRTVNRD